MGGIGLLVIVIVAFVLVRAFWSKGDKIVKEEKETSMTSVETKSPPPVQEESQGAEAQMPSAGEEVEAEKPVEEEKEEKEEEEKEKTKEETVEKEEEKKPPPPAPKDMVLIKAGEFWMGSIEGDSDEQPVHKVWLDAYYIDRYEVTVKKFQEFSEETGYPMPKQPIWNGENHPVVNVTWKDATVYARWAGKRLPTEAEWEKATRGGLSKKIFPWGNRSPGGRDANFADSRTNLSWKEKGVDDGYRYSAPVGSYKPNGYGLYDMAGNVWEWCSDWYNPHYFQQSTKKNPKGLESGYKNVVRGGSWLYPSYNIRCSSRNGLEPYYRGESGGFRCVLSVKID